MPQAGTEMPVGFDSRSQPSFHREELAFPWRNQKTLSKRHATPLTRDTSIRRQCWRNYESFGETVSTYAVIYKLSRQQFCDVNLRAQTYRCAPDADLPRLRGIKRRILKHGTTKTSRRAD